jgi:hypothetical protein
MMTGPPADTPVTIPELLPISAMVGSLLVQVPPVVASLRVVVAPWHTLLTPVIDPGRL